MPRRRLGFAAACGALSGVAAWTGGGYLAIDPLSGSPQIVGLLPSFTWLAAASLTGAAVALWTVSRGVAAPLFLLPCIGAIAWVTFTSWPSLVAWAGPALVIPFALLAVGLVIALTRTTPFRSRDDEQPDELSRARFRVRAIRFGGLGRWQPILALALATVWIGALFWTLAPLPVTGDEPHYLLAAQSVLADGDFDLKNQYDTLSYRPFYPGVLEPRHAVTGQLGQEFPFHGLGVSVLALPAFALAGVPGVRVLMVLMAAAGASFFWAAAWRFTRSASAAWMAWIALVSAAPFALHGILIYPDGMGAAIASIALWALVVIVTRSTISVPAIVGTGIALALLPWLHIRLSSMAGVLGAAIVVAMYQRRRDLLLPFMAAPIISFVLWIATTWVMFRTLDPTSVFRQKAAGSLAAMPTGALGMLFDAEYGLLVYAPVMALAALGIPATWRRSPLIAGSSMLLTMATLGVGAAWVWWGGDSAPARFLTPVIPLICLWFAAWWTNARAGARSFAGATMVIGGYLTLAIGIADNGLYITNYPDGHGTIFEWLSPNVELSLGMPSLFRPGATLATEAVVAALWLVTGALALLACVVLSDRRGSDPRRSWLVASASLVTWLMLGAGFGWWWHGAAPWTADRGQLRLLHAATSPALEVAMRAPAPQLTSREAVLSSLRIGMELPDASTVLHVPFAPAGRYTVSAKPAPRAAGEGGLGEAASPTAFLSLELGRGARPFATWPASASQTPAFSLAAPVYSVRVVATHGAKAEAGVVRLQPRAVAAPPLVPDIATRVTRYGDLAVYSFDPYSYPQAEGFWLAADRTGRIAIADLDGRMAPAILTITAQEAPTSITIWRGTFERTLTLAPRSTERIAVPREPEHALVWFTVVGGSSLQAGDGRRLGVFVGVSRE